MGRQDERSRRMLRLIAPILCVIEGFSQWSRSDLARMRRTLLAKAGGSEVGIGRMLSAHDKLRAGLRDYRNEV
jgi:hypothetical protein